MELAGLVQGLNVFFNERRVLSDVNVDFSNKKLTVLLGRSGSGKTILLRALNRLNECLEGYRGEGDVRVRIDEELVSVNAMRPASLPFLRQKVGMVFQTPNPLPLSVKKNLLLPLQLVLNKKGAEAEAQMKKQLERVGLWDEVSSRLNAPAQTLSGGQQQRLCIARTLALEPEMLLLDEPTASLDRVASSTIEELIFSLKKQYTIVMVSHSLRQALELADDFVIVSEGVIKATFARHELPPGALEAESHLERWI